MVTVKRDHRNNVSIEDTFLKVHHGNPQQLFESVIETLPLKEYARVAVTGRKFRHLVNLTSIPEPEAVEEAFLHINGTGPRHPGHRQCRQRDIYPLPSGYGWPHLIGPCGK